GLTLGNFAISAVSVTDIVLLVRATNIEECGGRIIISPTPAVLFAVSSDIPVVRPTMTRISITSSATARMLTVVRTGRALKPAMIICFFISLHRLLRQVESLCPFRTRQIPCRGIDFLVHLHTPHLKRHLDLELLNWPLDNEGLR